MNRQTRRGFLKKAVVVGGSLALRPWSLWAEEGAAAGEGGLPEMSIARWAGEHRVEEEVGEMAARLAESAISALGGMGRFVGKGDSVWVKPNMAWNRPPELAATTNPDVVAALVRLAYEAGAKKVRVGDNTCHNAKQCYVTTRIEAAAEAAGAEVVYLDENRFRRVSLGGKRLSEWELCPELVESDLVINVPIAKHHGLSRATLAMKNYMGVVGGKRNTWHQDLATCLCDITAYMKPRLVVLDAVRVLTANGPQGGNPSDVKRLDTVAAGTDIVAIDAFGAELLGHEPADLETIRKGMEAGLGTMDYRSLPLEEVTAS